MPSPSPLPPGLPTAFTVDDARDAGVSASRLRRTDLARPLHGARARDELTDLERLRLLLAVVPLHACAAGATAAALHGLPLPLGEERHAFDRPVLAVPAGATRVRRPGVRGCVLELTGDDVVRRRGVRTLGVARTWVHLSSRLGLADLVAVTDRILSRRSPMADVDELDAAAARFAKAPFSTRRAQALRLADSGSESPRESWTRVTLAAAGLPAPACNVEIFDGSRFVARVDMLFREQMLVVEYQGDHHRDRHQWRRDELRRAELEALGYRVTYVTAEDISDPSRLVARIRRLLAAARP
ncbi:endonuclease domain-containing protein [Microbacterium phosphatis]|uniref:endonuclease domain-containing protein n=1 Tax=Microbacterium phosphatis TaxID=3140248 RepID=UPI0031409B51